MPYRFVTEQTEWREGMTVLGKVGKPGSKIIVHGNGRQSINFTVTIPSSIPFGMAKNPNKTYAPLYVRCRMFDPEELLNTGDVVRVTGIPNRDDNYLGLLVNKIEVLARWIRNKDWKSSRLSLDGQVGHAQEG